LNSELRNAEWLCANHYFCALTTAFKKAGSLSNPASLKIDNVPKSRSITNKTSAPLSIYANRKAQQNLSPAQRRLT